MSKKGKKHKKRKLKLKAIFIFLVILTSIILSVYYILHKKITNIYIIGNSLYTDEEIIKIADIENYPSIIDMNAITIKNNLEEEKLIKKVSVRRKGLFKLYITITENYPLFYYQDKTYLYDLTTVSKNYMVPFVVNEIATDKFKEFCNCMKNVDLDILNRISEIKYDPNDVDKERFYLTMNDGIYVYVTLNKFDKINDYSDIVSTLDNKKGVLYLDSGEYFEVFNE